MSIRQATALIPFQTFAATHSRQTNGNTKSSFLVPAPSPNEEESLAVPEKPKLLGEYSSLKDWKTDRAEIFEKYKEAGEKASLPMMVTIVSPMYGKIASKSNEESTSSYSILDRHRFDSQKANKTAEENDAPSHLGAWTKEETQKFYGNYFVYNMEKLSNQLNRSIESIKHNQQSVMENELKLANTADENHQRPLRQLISSGKEWIAHCEADISKTLHAISGWAEAGDVVDEAKQFFQEYTRDYLGNEQSLESLQEKYVPDEIKPTIPETVSGVDYIKSLNEKYKDVGSNIPMPSMGLLVPDPVKYAEIIKNTNPFVFNMQNIANGLNFSIDQLNLYTRQQAQLAATPSSPDIIPTSEKLAETKSNIKEALTNLDNWAKQYGVKAQAENFLSEYSKKIFEREMSLTELEKIYLS